MFLQIFAEQLLCAEHQGYRGEMRCIFPNLKTQGQKEGTFMQIIMQSDQGYKRNVCEENECVSVCQCVGESVKMSFLILVYLKLG